MFEEFIVPAYKKIYGYYKFHGVELIVHHSDSCTANLVPAMIDVGIDIWQGCIDANDIPSLIKEYGGQISFMGGIDNSKIDKEDCTP
ncbi:MAG: uroporphyrinogen decarboxylase family protein, partial [Eubacterium aggregans]